MSERKHIPHPSHSELFYPDAIPFNLAGELLDNSTTAEGEARVRALAESEARKAQQTFGAAWIETPSACHLVGKPTLPPDADKLRASLHESNERLSDEIKRNGYTGAQPAEFAGPFPRKRHSHRCPLCTSSVACYKAQCRKPQRITREQCPYCRPVQRRPHEARGSAASNACFGAL